MYVIPPHSSTPRWMPSAADQCFPLGSTSANKQRMASIKRKHVATEDDDCEGHAGSLTQAPRPMASMRYTHASVAATSTESDTPRLDKGKRQRVMPTVHFDLAPSYCVDTERDGAYCRAPTPLGMDVDMSAESDLPDDTTSSPSSSTSSLSHSSSSPDNEASASAAHCQSYFPEQCLRLSISTPTGHPHPYATASPLWSASPSPNGRPTRSELGAGYFDAVQF